MHETCLIIIHDPGMRLLMTSLPVGLPEGPVVVMRKQDWKTTAMYFLFTNISTLLLSLYAY